MGVTFDIIGKKELLRYFRYDDCALGLSQESERLAWRSGGIELSNFEVLKDDCGRNGKERPGLGI